MLRVVFGVVQFRFRELLQALSLDFPYLVVANEAMGSSQASPVLLGVEPLLLRP